MTLHDVVALCAITGAATVAAALLGALVLRRTRGRSARVQALLIAVGSMFAMVVGIVIAAEAMFISSHDLRALLIVVVTSGAVATGAAWQLGADIGAGTRHVRTLAQQLGDGGPTNGGRTGGPGELDVLAAELADVSTRLCESRERERALEQSRRELIAWMSHDLRAPLATIRAMGEALDDDVIDGDLETTRRYHHQIRRDAERLSVLVDDLFELSRIQHGMQRPSEVDVAPLSDVVADALANARATARLKGITLVDRVGHLPTVDVPGQELLRVLHNLLDNAIRHTPTGGSVVVESIVDSDVTTLSVVDECGGIPAPDIDRVFDVAFRGDTARAKDKGGGGLGLAIAKGLVEANAGSIEVANHDCGCRFTVRLPVAT